MHKSPTQDMKKTCTAAREGIQNSWGKAKFILVYKLYLFIE